MAATGPDFSRRRALLCTVALSAWPLRAANPLADPRAGLSYVCSALASGNPSDALRPFDKNMPGYDRIEDYFAALTAAFDVSSSVELTDITDGTQAKLLTVNWTLNLTSKVDPGTATRVKPEKIKFVRQGEAWKIVSLSDLSLFQP